MFNNVSKDGTYFVAYDENNTRVLIEQSISFLFLKTQDPKQTLYAPVTYKNNPEVLHQINDYLTGCTMETGLLDRVVIRGGWMDRKLNSLTFTPLLDVVKRFRNNEATKRDKYKLIQLCKQLSISQRSLYIPTNIKTHIEPSDLL